MKKTLAVFFLGLLFFSFVPSLVLAGGTGCPPPGQGLVPCGNVDTCPCELCDLFLMVDRIIDFLLLPPPPIGPAGGGGIVLALAGLMIAIGGGMYIFAFGKPEMISRAKKLFTAVVIGLIIIYGAWVIVNTFLIVIGAAQWQGFGQGWWIIDCQ